MNRNLILAIIFGLFTAKSNLNCAEDGHNIESLRRQIKDAQKTVKNIPEEIAAPIAADYSPKDSAEDNSIFAKITLLNDYWTHFQGSYQYSTLLNGADLYENNVISGLYTLLVSSSKKVAPDGHELISPDLTKTTNSLGKWLYQFFYRTGATLSFTKAQSQFSYYLTPTQIGQLYTMSFDIDKNEILIKSLKPKKMSWPQFNLFVDNYKAVFSKNPTPTSVEDNVMHNLARAILLSFFWAKFVANSAISTKTAQDNIAQLYAAIDTNPGDPIAVNTKRMISIELETKEIIERIVQNYTSLLPKPPTEGTVELPDGKEFPDCGESCIRGLLLAAFYVPQTRSLVIPNHPENPDFYSPELHAYFKEFPNLIAQSSNLAREKWGIMLSGRPDIEYNEPGYDLKTSLTNTATLVAQLVPGSYQNFLVAAGEEVNLEPKAIHDYLSSSKKHAEGFLKQFAQDHKLDMFGLKEKGDDILFKIQPKDKDRPVIEYTLKPKHMDCLLKFSTGISSQISNDPLISYDRSKITTPLLFAAYDLATNGLFNVGYFKLLPMLPKAEIDSIVSNIKDWGNLRPEDKEILNDPDEALYQALEKNFKESAEYIIENYIDKDTSAIIARAIDRPKLVKKLIEQGFNVNIREKMRHDDVPPVTPLESAVLLKNDKVAEILLKNSADFTIPYTYDYAKRTILDYVKETETENSPLRQVFEKYAN